MSRAQSRPVITHGLQSGDVDQSSAVIWARSDRPSRMLVDVKAPPNPEVQNLPPSAGLQFFGLVDIDGTSEQMTVRLMDRDDKELYKVTLDPVRMG